MRPEGVGYFSLSPSSCSLVFLMSLPSPQEPSALIDWVKSSLCWTTSADWLAGRSCLFLYLNQHTRNIPTSYSLHFTMATRSLLHATHSPTVPGWELWCYGLEVKTWGPKKTWHTELVLQKKWELHHVCSSESCEPSLSLKTTAAATTSMIRTDFHSQLVIWTCTKTQLNPDLKQSEKWAYLLVHRSGKV